ncbi:MAG: hypothetical protein RLZZ162_2667, partial [Verrucomicrobiota bacterium]
APTHRTKPPNEKCSTQTRRDCSASECRLPLRLAHNFALNVAGTSVPTKAAERLKSLPLSPQPHRARATPLTTRGFILRAIPLREPVVLRSKGGPRAGRARRLTNRARCPLQVPARGSLPCESREGSRFNSGFPASLLSRAGLRRLNPDSTASQTSPIFVVAPRSNEDWPRPKMHQNVVAPFTRRSAKVPSQKGRADYSSRLRG